MVAVQIRKLMGEDATAMIALNPSLLQLMANSINSLSLSEDVRVVEHLVMRVSKGVAWRHHTCLRISFKGSSK